MNQKTCIQILKVVNVSYLYILYTFIGIILSLVYVKISDKLFNSQFINSLYTKEHHKKDPKTYFENPKILFHLIMYTTIDAIFIGITAYTLRRTVKRIPFGLNGLCGYDKNLLKEINGGVLIAALSMAYFTYKDKLTVYSHLWEYDKTKFIYIIVYILFIIAIFNSFGLFITIK